MRKRGARASVVVIATILPIIVASCLDFGSLSGTDAGADASSDGSVVSDSPIVVNDASPSSDGSFDAGADARFCAANPGHSLCDDFDDVNFLTPFNQPRLLSTDGIAAQNGDAFVSPPYSLEATLPILDAATEAWVVNQFATTPNEMTIEFELYLANVGDSTTAVISIFFPNHFSFTFKLSTPIPLTMGLVEVGPTDAGVSTYVNVDNIGFIVSPKTWHHVYADLVLQGASAGKIQFAFDHGTVVDTVAPIALDFADGGATTLQAGIGSFSNPPYFSTSVRLDNFVVDLK